VRPVRARDHQFGTQRSLIFRCACNPLSSQEWLISAVFSLSPIPDTRYIGPSIYRDADDEG
jgi:hypothetical protein